MTHVPFDRMGAAYEAHARDGAYNAHYDRPAMLEVIGEVRDLDVLDAACGPGLYARALHERGARVRAFDASAEMVRLARQRLAGSAQVDVADLDDVLPYRSAEFDVVVCALAIHYSADRQATFDEFFRVLRPSSRCVVSTQHPMADWIRRGGSYFDVQQETESWGSWSGDEAVTFWREPLSRLSAAATDAGFLISRIVEPEPTESMGIRWPKDYEKLRTEPGFLILDLIKL